MSISPEWVGIGLTAIGAAVAVGRLWQRVADQGTAASKCLGRREQMELQIFMKLDDLAKGVNKIKGKMDLNGD